MKVRVVSMLASFTVCCAVGLIAQTSTNITYKFAPINYPGALATEAFGINNHNVVVGSYVDSSNQTHGFKLNSGSFSPINFPGAIETQALGVNDNGDIVGWYLLTNQPNAPTHGFLLHSGTYKSIDYPGAKYGTEAAGINNSGAIVGNFDSNSQGFLYQNGTFTAINAPQLPGELLQTVLLGISNSGMMAGWVLSGDSLRGFWTPTNASDYDFLEPLGTPDNSVSGINARNDIVGCDISGNGFIAFNVEASEARESTERFPAREVPSIPFATQGSCINGINYARMIVGRAGTSSGGGEGFLGAPVLTLSVSAPVTGSTQSNPVHVVASASGVNSLSQIQVWVNSKEIYRVKGSLLNAYIKLPLGSNERLVVQAVDSKGTLSKVLERVTVK
jgi:hypothetical protein